jgi:hypothetical protein
MPGPSSKGLRVLFNSRRSLGVEQQVLKSYTGLEHFKFCYDSALVKDLAGAKQVLPLVSQRKGFLLLPLPVPYLFLHLEAVNH